jgi:hypothetical protein
VVVDGRLGDPLSAACVGGRYGPTGDQDGSPLNALWLALQGPSLVVISQFTKIIRAFTWDRTYSNGCLIE